MKSFVLSLLNRLSRVVNRCFYFMLFTLMSAGFFEALNRYIDTKQFSQLATVCGPILAVLFGFAALLYNRGRALPSGREQRRSLYAAERAMQAALLFLIGCAVGGIGAVMVWLLGDGRQFEVSPYWSGFSHVLFLCAVMFVLYSFLSFFLALRTVAHKLVKWLPMRNIIRGLK